MAKLIVQWDRDECYVNGPDLSKVYNFEEDSGSFVTEDGTVDDDSITYINEFLKKYKDLHSDIHKIFHISEDYMAVMIELSGGQELLLPENNNSVFAKLFASNLDNKRGPGFGLEPFPEQFYQELFNIFEDGGEIDSGIRGTLSGNFEGYYSFTAEIKPNGILWDTEYYQYEGDGDYGDCQGCGEELWSEEDDTNISDTHEGYCFLCARKMDS